LIHCVKAYDETLLQLKRASVPAIFHGFNKNSNFAQKVLDQGHYLSFGAALLRSATVMDVFSKIDLSRCFFETVDSDISIQDVYAAAAQIRNIEEDAIILQLQENYKTVFN